MSFSRSFIVLLIGLSVGCGGCWTSADGENSNGGAPPPNEDPATLADDGDRSTDDRNTTGGNRPSPTATPAPDQDNTVPGATSANTFPFAGTWGLRGVTFQDSRSYQCDDVMVQIKQTETRLEVDAFTVSCRSGGITTSISTSALRLEYANDKIYQSGRLVGELGGDVLKVTLQDSVVTETMIIRLKDGIGFESATSISIPGMSSVTTLSARTFTKKPSPNQAPDSTNASFTMNENEALASKVTAVDWIEDRVTFNVGLPPSHGTLTLDAATGDFEYHPAPGFHGADHFTFVASDGTASSLPGTISITVRPLDLPPAPVNNPPAPVSDTVALNEDTSVSFQLKGTDTDGDALAFTVTGGPTHGVLSGTLPNLIYTPATNYHGVDHVDFTVSDGTSSSAGSGRITLNVTNTNDAPVATPQTISLTRGGSRQLVLSGADVDSSSLSYHVVSNPSHGTLSVSLSRVTYTPDPDYAGADSFQFRVSDGLLESTPATISISVIAEFLQERDGRHFVQDDILVDAPAEGQVGAASASVGSESPLLWPDGVIPYVIDPSVADHSRVEKAVAEFHERTQLRFVPRTNESDYLFIERAPTSCASFVGRRGGKQSLLLSDACSVGNLMHELGHAIGLFHEQTRTDRDQYVRILFQNVLPGKAFEFARDIDIPLPIFANRREIGEYDTTSIMHSDTYAFSRNGLPTIEALNDAPYIGQRIALSPKDVAAIAEIYDDVEPTAVLDNPFASGTLELSGRLFLPGGVPAGRAISLYFYKRDWPYTSVIKTVALTTHTTTIKYRITGLAAGRYLVKASVNVNGNDFRDDRGDASGYYSASASPTLNEASAVIIDLTSQSISNLDIALGVVP